MSARELIEQFEKRTGLTQLACAKPFDLKTKTPANPFLMAPMAGVSDAAWRLMAWAGGAALAYTEMISVAGIHYKGSKTWDLVLPNYDEPSLAVQLFGSEPDQFKEAASAVCERLGDKLALIDINMACPVPKVVKKGEGSALLDNPERAAAIVAATCSEVHVPVSVKIRRGIRIGEENCAEFSRAMESAGASAIAVHGRYAKQLYRGASDWNSITRCVEAVSIPVIASGDILNAEAATQVLEKTGANFCMVARGSYGNPWIFSQALAIRSGEQFFLPSSLERLNAFRLHIRLLSHTHAHLARARSLAGWYLKGMPDAASWRRRAMHCSTEEDFLHLCDLIEASWQA